ncbi:transketolase family protein [Candidatus Bathyarchaeota archaeon]|nr:MAG: transketolase family protein [Candidatus Bathyarchaeota archaeon]
MSLKETRGAYGEWLQENGANTDIVVVDADLSASTRTNKFSSAYPERFFDVGAAEQNLVAFSAGLALGGKKVFASSFAYFETGRAWDQIRNLIAHDKLDVQLVASHGGLSCASDGASHQALEDLAITRVIPNLKVLVPCDAEETKNTLNALLGIKGPSYMRLRRDKEPVLEKNYEYKLGKIETMKEGTDLTIAAIGSQVYYALAAAETLKSKGINAEVLNVHTLKPLDADTLVRSARKTGLVLTTEQHQINGGLGGAVAEVLAENYPAHMKIMGVNDTFSETAREQDELMVHHGLTADHIVEAAQKLIEKTRK